MAAAAVLSRAGRRARVCDGQERRRQARGEACLVSITRDTTEVWLKLQPSNSGWQPKRSDECICAGAEKLSNGGPWDQ